MIVTDLVKLGKETIKLWDEFIEQTKIQLPKRIYIQHTTNDLVVTESSSHFGWSTQVVEKPDWNSTVFEVSSKSV